jgi:prepilin-type N-terminal cleavage/methylation domain-containing protein
VKKQCLIRGPQLGRSGASRESDDSTASREAGFTLIELLIVTVILPLVVGAMAYALVAVFSLQGGATSRLTNSDDAQTVSAVYESDVQSATQITTETASQCGTSGTQLLGLQWSSGTFIVSYDEVGTSSPYSLVRNYCTGGSTTPTTSTTVSANLPANQPSPTFSCATWGNCTAITRGWIPAGQVSDVTFHIIETGSGSTAQVGAFDYTLVATPGVYLDQITGPGGGGSPIYPLALLGQPSCTNPPTPILNMTGSSSVTVEVPGSSPPVLLPIYVASTCPDAITLIPGQTLKNQVSNIITNDPNTTTPGADSYCVLTNKNGNTCDPTQTLPSESAPTAGSVNDPLANSLTPPTNPTLPPSCLNVACPQGEEFSTAQSMPVSLTAGDTYIFDQNVTISGNITFNFPPGTYWFKAGLTMAASTVNFGSGTYHFGSPSGVCPTFNNNPTCLDKTNSGAITTDSTNGVLFYVENGAATFSGSSQVSISAAQSGYPLNALYGEVALWDISTLPLSITNGAAATDNFSGIYDPNGKLVLSGSGAMDISFIEANSASLTGSGSLTLGQ